MKTSKVILAAALSIYLTATLVFTLLFWFHPRIETVTIEIPGPAPAAPDSVRMIILSGLDRLRLSTAALERANSDLRRQLAVQAIEKALPAEIRWTIPPVDTSIGLKLYRSDKTFIHPTMYFGSIESHIEATAPAPVTSFMNTIRFMDGDQAVVDRIQKQYRIQNPCPPGHFWTGFGYGGMTGFALALAAVLFIGK